MRNVNNLLAALEFNSRRHACPLTRTYFAQAAAEIREQQSKISNLTTELDWWRTKHIRSEPMDPKAPPANLPAVIKPEPPKVLLVASGARLLKWRPGGEMRPKP